MACEATINHTFTLCACVFVFLFLLNVIFFQYRSRLEQNFEWFRVKAKTTGSVWLILFIYNNREKTYSPRHIAPSCERHENSTNLCDCLNINNSNSSSDRAFLPTVFIYKYTNRAYNGYFINGMAIKTTLKIIKLTLILSRTVAWKHYDAFYGQNVSICKVSYW